MQVRLGCLKSYKEIKSCCTKTAKCRILKEIIFLMKRGIRVNYYMFNDEETIPYGAEDIAKYPLP